jgi:hypothetical protein
MLVRVLSLVLPTVAFMALDSFAGLGIAAVGAVVVAVVLCGLRFRESVGQALLGLALAGSCALVASLTGQPRGFFLVPMAVPLLALVVCLASVAVGRPLTGIVGNRLVGGPGEWWRISALRRGYARTTVALAGVSLVSLVAQVVLYQANQPGWLAVMHVAAAPMWLGATAIVLVLGRRAVSRLG